MKDEVGDGKAESFSTGLRQSRSINPATPRYRWQMRTA